MRGVGWIQSTKDIEQTVVKADPETGTPICVSHLGTVSQGSEFRRSVLEKNGNEAVGAVVMMRHGENPLEVTQRIKAKIQELQAGLPEGVRIVPFYDRTRLIHGAIEMISETLLHEMIIASVAIFADPNALPQCAVDLPDPAPGRAGLVHSDAAPQRVLERHVPGGDCDFHRHPG